MPEINDGAWPPEYEELITSCWHTDPTIRPTFLEIMTRLSSMHGDSSTQGATSFTSKTSSSSSGGRTAVGLHSSWTLPTGTASSSSAASGSSSSSSGSQKHVATGAAAGVRPPEGEVTIVFTDITRAASLWEFNAMAMRDATLLHNETLRSALHKHRGYEVVFLRDKNSGEGSFCMAFQHTADAMAWCLEVQQNLLNVTWPEALLEHPGAAEEWSDVDDRVLFKGLRVRMGVHVGVPRVGRDPMTRRVEYIGPVVNAAARITAMTHGGQIVLSHTVHNKIKESADPQQQEEDGQSRPRRTLVSLGKFEIPDTPQGTTHTPLYAQAQTRNVAD
jgi:class 3 adenylate cyclase